MGKQIQTFLCMGGKVLGGTDVAVTAADPMNMAAGGIQLALRGGGGNTGGGGQNNACLFQLL